MSSERDLVRTVEGCWRALRDEVEGIDLSTPVYPIPLWTLRDVLMHCAFWNEEAVKSLEAHADGGGYVTDTATASFDPGGDAMEGWGKAHLNGSGNANVTDRGADSFAAGLDAMNQRVVEASRSLTDDQVDYRWVVAQNGLIEALLSLEGAAMSREIICPWHERASVEEMVLAECGHEQGHIDDVLSALASMEPPG